VSILRPITSPVLASANLSLRIPGKLLATEVPAFVSGFQHSGDCFISEGDENSLGGGTASVSKTAPALMDPIPRWGSVIRDVEGNPYTASYSSDTMPTSNQRYSNRYAYLKVVEVESHKGSDSIVSVVGEATELHHPNHMPIDRPVTFIMHRKVSQILGSRFNQDLLHRDFGYAYQRKYPLAPGDNFQVIKQGIPNPLNNPNLLLIDVHPQLDQDSLTIGRSEMDDNDIVVSEPGVSGFHGSLQRRPDSWYIVDGDGTEKVRSTNGVFVNGIRASFEWPITDGDIINLGDGAAIRFHEPK